MKLPPPRPALAGCLWLLLLALFSFLVVMFPLTNTDIWWHLASGREIVRGGTIPRSDPFSVSSLDRPWTNLHWLFQVAVYLLWHLGGVSALVLGKCLLLAVAAVILLKAGEAHIRADLGASPRHWRPLSAAVLAVLVFAGRELVFMRPVVFSLLYTSLFLYLLGRYRQRPRRRYLAALLVVQVLWANSQPLFPLGLVITACFLAGEGLGRLAERRGWPGFAGGLPARALLPLAVTWLLLLAASLATPYGVEGLLLPGKLFLRIDPAAANLFGRNVSENLPSWLLARSGAGPAAWFPWVLGATLGSFLLSPRRLSLGRLLLLGALLVPALMANRNLLLLFWVSGPLLLANAAMALPHARREGRGRIVAGLATSPWLAVLLLGALVLPLSSRLRAQGPLSVPAPFRVPIAASEVIEKLPARGHIFNSVRYGGYLIWKLYPARRPFIDGRLVLRSGGQFAAYLAVLDHPERFAGYARTHDLRTAVLPVAQPDRYRRLIATLYRADDWRLVFTDGTQTVFTREAGGPETLDLADRRTVAGIAASLSRRFANDPAARARAHFNLGLLLDVTGNPTAAVAVLEGCSGRRARALLARSLYLAGRRRRAGEISRRLLVEDPGDIDSLLLLAQLARESGRLTEALELVGRVLEVNPHHLAARQLLQGMRRPAATAGGGDHVPE